MSSAMGRSLPELPEAKADLQVARQDAPCSRIAKSCEAKFPVRLIMFFAPLMAMCWISAAKRSLPIRSSNTKRCTQKVAALTADQAEATPGTAVVAAGMAVVAAEVSSPNTEKGKAAATAGAAAASRIIA